MTTETIPQTAHIETDTLPQPSVELLLVTPEMAELWLGRMASNRHLSDVKVDEYGKDMADDLWQLNAETIKIDPDGRLVDGQHRLRGIIRSGKPQRMFVAFGVDASVIESIDTGRRRTLSDLLALRGESQAITLASVITLQHMLEVGLQHQAPAGTTGGRNRLSHRRALDVLERHPGLRESARAGDTARKGIGMRASVAGITHYQFCNIDVDDAEAFFSRLKDGAGLQPRDPLLVLREAILRDVRDRRSAGRAMSQQYQWALIIKAWNAFREGREVTLLKWKRGGASPESFPVPA